MDHSIFHSTIKIIIIMDENYLICDFNDKHVFFSLNRWLTMINNNNIEYFQMKWFLICCLTITILNSYESSWRRIHWVGVNQYDVLNWIENDQLEFGAFLYIDGNNHAHTYTIQLMEKKIDLSIWFKIVIEANSSISNRRNRFDWFKIKNNNNDDDDDVNERN